MTPTHEMPANQRLARMAFKAIGLAHLVQDFGGPIAAPVEAAYGYQHGWIVINGESFNHDKAFPEIQFPRFPADQGCSD